MNPERAKRILAALRKHGVTNSFAIPCEGMTFWHVPAGNAEWCSHEPCRGGVFYGADLGITCWPKTHIYSLFDGIPHLVDTPPIWSRFRLWQQEAYVYRLETFTALKRAMIEMDKLFPLPRLPGHDVNDVDPYPEDFGSDVTRKVNQICVEAIEDWLRSVPIETAAA